MRTSANPNPNRNPPLSYYMWTGGSNFGRWAGDGITTMYAVDAIVCPDGLPHEPKFTHTAAMQCVSWNGPCTPAEPSSVANSAPVLPMV